MATLGSQGFVDDGSNNLTVLGLSITSQNAMSPQALGGNASVNIPGPGFFQIPITGSAGQGSFTGSLPSPSSFPGGEILITDTVGTYPWMLSGSITLMGNATGSSGIANATSFNGTKLTCPPGGTVGLWSDSKGWIICAVSGTVVLRP